MRLDEEGPEGKKPRQAPVRFTAPRRNWASKALESYFTRPTDWVVVALRAC